MRSTIALITAAGALLALGACNMRQDQAGPNSADGQTGNSSGAVTIDKTPLSSTPGAAPDNSQVEPRDPATR